jgi:DNA-binding PadR family transcriptional regulator
MRQEGPGKRARRLYTITPTGETALAEVRNRVRELFSELFEKDS